MSGRLKNDCFALPPGVNWTPVAEAKARLKGSLTRVVDHETVVLQEAHGRILASSVTARRAHPPHANSAVDGYGVGLVSGRAAYDLLSGRAAAGQAFDGALKAGEAVRVLTGAPIPEGADAVVLEEDVRVEGNQVLYDGALKPGANIRTAGEDVREGRALLKAGRRLSAGDVALLASVGTADVPVFARLRVAVLSTGSEVVAPAAKAAPEQIFDANRPMLASILASWGVEVVDLGCVPDDRAQVAAALDRGAQTADMIVTSGGASAGDEDHISASLREAGVLSTWRIALKPGRPLAMGLWGGTPVFGLPGNPVAAFVCALLFVRPAIAVLGGSQWNEPLGFELKAAFEKRKKPGREEYLRARRRDDTVEVFASEGSGRVSGLSWADGLVALEHDRGPVAHGDAVRFIPFSEFGLS